MTSTISTKGGGRLTISPTVAPFAALLLEGGIESPDRITLARNLPGNGITVARFEQPWRVAEPPETPDRGWLGSLDAVVVLGLLLVVAGRPAGAHVVCRCFAPLELGVLCLSFPLYSPGGPEKPQTSELADAPVLVLQGGKDPLGLPSEVGDAAPGVWVTGVHGT